MIIWRAVRGLFLALCGKPARRPAASWAEQCLAAKRQRRPSRLEDFAGPDLSQHALAQYDIAHGNPNAAFVETSRAAEPGHSGIYS
jgi:hypothetical protein